MTYTKKEMFRFVLKKTSGYKYIIVILLIFGMLIKYLDTLEPIFSSDIINTLIDGNFNNFLIILAKLFVLLIVGMILSIVLSYWQFYTQKGVAIKLESSLYEKMLKNKDITRDDVGKKINIISDDIDTMTSVVMKVIPDFLLKIITVLLISYRLYNIHGKIFIFVLATTVPSLFVSLIFGNKKKAIREQQIIRQDKYIDWLSSTLSMTTMFATTTSIIKAKEKFITIMKSFYKVSLSSLNLNTLINIITTLINILTTFALYGYVGYCIYRGETTVGSYVAIIMYSKQLKLVITSFSSFYYSLLSSEVSISRIMYIEEVKHQKIFQEIDKSFIIDVDNFTFSYENQINIFEDYSLSLKGPGIFLIKGKNGCGKTTLLNSICGFAPNNINQKGTIKYESNQVYYLSQSQSLFNIPLIDFLTYDFESVNVNKELVRDVLNDIGLYDIVTDNTTDKGYNRELIKDLNLSKGQTQRLCFARAILSGKKIVIIDEIEASLDQESILKIYRLLEKYSNSRLFVMATHSNVFNSLANKIYFIE